MSKLETILWSLCIGGLLATGITTYYDRQNAIFLPPTIPNNESYFLSLEEMTKVTLTGKDPCTTYIFTYEAKTGALQYKETINTCSAKVAAKP
ncbi:MAG: hypothetical protein KC548_05135 [Nanoarchaeota archaeon]|nr:hypothetical protein [Nanoarchaeota archaeon]